MNRILLIELFYMVKTPRAVRQDDEKLIYEFIQLFSSTEIFSKRRKIYTWNGLGSGFMG